MQARVPTSPGRWSLGGAPMTRVGRARVGALIVTSDEMNQLSSELTKFETDVNAVVSKEVFTAGAALDKCIHDGLAWDAGKNVCLDTPNPGGGYPDTIQTPLLQFRNSDVANLLAQWQSFIASQLPTSIAVGPFQQIKQQFQDAVAKWTGPLGQTTSAVPPKVVASGAADDLADLGQSAAAWLPWIIGIGALVVGAVYLGPVIAPAIGDFAGRAGKLVGGKK